MAEPIRLQVPSGFPPERLDRFLADNLSDFSRAQIRKLIDDGLVQVDGALVKAGHKLKGGEDVVICPPEPEPVIAEPEPIPLDILFEDGDIIVVDKPAGMVVHPAPGHMSGTLVNALLYHCRDLAGIGGALRPGIVHRLDKDTSGVMVATKNDRAHQALAEQFKAHSIRRRYLALVHGHIQKDSGVIDRPIGRHPVDRKRMSSHARHGRRAVTRWQVLRRFDRDKLTLVELALETGRTHQIRVHFSEMNLPLVGDPVYGQPRRARAIGDTGLRRLVEGLGRQALHARLLMFRHPATGQVMTFTSPVPEDFGLVLDYLDRRYQLDGSSRMATGHWQDDEAMI